MRVVSGRRYHRGMPPDAPDPPAGDVSLRAVEPADLPVLFRNQLDPEANRLAGTKPRGPEAFRALWEQALSDPDVVARVILSGGVVAGGISCFKADGVDAVGYWIGREHWGRGVATRALALFLGEVTRRPLHATAARANAGSIRVLERCGFRLTGHAMGEETDRYLPGEVAEFVLE